MACASNSEPCAQSHPIRGYFIALLITVVCLVCLRMILFASYYAWLRIIARRQLITRMTDLPRDGVQSLPSTADNPQLLSTSVCMIDPRVCVVVPGKDHPTFVAMPAPLAPFKDPSAQILSVKCTAVPKRGSATCAQLN